MKLADGHKRVSENDASYDVRWEAQFGSSAGRRRSRRARVRDAVSASVVGSCLCRRHGRTLAHSTGPSGAAQQTGHHRRKMKRAELINGGLIWLL